MTAVPATTVPADGPPAAPGPPPQAPGRTRGRAGPATRQAVAANSTHVHFTAWGTEVEVTLPPLDKMAFYVGLGGAAALGVMEWPIALVTGLGHLLTDDRRNRTLHALGEALDAA